jgi:glycosyltransferase involved in cell wall biosynthesis
MAAPLTVVITTRDRAPLLAGAIESVLRSPLVGSPADVLVVDDESGDETPEVARRLGVRYHRAACGRCSVARNTGLALVESEFVAFLDDDDVWLPGNMEAQLAALRRSPAAAFAFGRVQRATPELEPVGEPFPSPPLPSGDGLTFFYRVHLQVGAVLFRRGALVAEGGFDPTVGFMEDSDLLVRLAAKHPVEGVDAVGVLYRQRRHSVASGEHRWESHRDYVRGLRRLRQRGVRLPLRLRLQTDLHFRGMTSYYFCADAESALAQGDRSRAARYLGYALRVSPAHTLLRHRRFWTTLGRLPLPAPVPGREPATLGP